MSVREYYDSYWQESGYAGTTSMHPGLERVLGGVVEETDSCIDVGCGDGGTAGEWLTGSCREYLGVDVSEAAVEAAAGRGLNARVVDDAASLPFGDGEFDVAVCIEVMEHLFEPEAALHEMARILKPGGTAIVTVPNVAHWRTRADLGLLGRWAGRGDARSAGAPWLDPHIRFFTPSSLGSFMASAGLERLDQGGYSHLGLLQSVPLLRGLARGPGPGPVSHFLARAWPAMFASRLYAVATRA